jgi:hypothetical protein
MTAPSVLGLGLERAKESLEAEGFSDIEILVSGRRREGRPRVIRQINNDSKLELVVSYFKELNPIP